MTSWVTLGEIRTFSEINILPIDNNKYLYAVSNPNNFEVLLYIAPNPNNHVVIPANASYYPITLANGSSTLGLSNPDLRDFKVTMFYQNKNTAPTTPGTFTQPTGDLEIGANKVISWGASSDSENNLSYYALEVSINGGAWTQIGIPSSVSFNYTIPSCSSIQFRVKGVDSGGLSSPYQTSASYKVGKPKYYYNKHNVDNVVVGLNYPAPRSTYNTAVVFSTFQGRYVTYAGEKIGVDGRWGANESISVGDTCCYILSNFLTIHTAIEAGNASTDTRVSVAEYYITEFTFRRSDTIGTLLTANIIADDGAYPTNGKYSDGYWYVRGNKVTNAVSPPSSIALSSGVLKYNNSVNFTASGSTVSNPIYKYQYSFDNVNFTDFSTAFTLPRDVDKKLLYIRARTYNGTAYSDYFTQTFDVYQNTAPTVELNTENNKTLYEGDTFKIDGSSTDPDNGDIVNVKYQINGGMARAIKTDISTGSAILFNRPLTFKGGKLYDGETALTDALAEGVSHELKVFAEDDQKGKSTEQIRNFYVVPNRAPAIVINPIEKPNGTVDSDKFPISGVCSDPDGNDVIVSYKINTSLATEIYRGKGGDWTFDVAFSSLKIGENIIIVEVIDSHNFKTSKTIKLNKAVNSTPILNSVARYKIVPPTGTAKGVLLWIQKEKGLNIEAEISMTEAGVQEKFVEMPLTNSAPIDSFITEDQFVYEAAEMKENIIVKLNLSRESAEVSDSITLISGVLS
ncbi:hypothetical protein ACQKMD_11280 [Viridibacillus sp. NPDC096237]|uniref:hypothetical protein n=1 Tax=Viridibacillus sp. NPDC096237 TaxID=3390721 RepID=UPI003D041E06